MKLASKIIATFFGLGYLPVAPGTFTSMVCIILYKLYLHQLSWPLYLFFLLIVFFIGSFASTKYSKELNQKDPRKIVIDEAFGQFLVLFQMGVTLPLLLLSFILFRFFDIVKPYPIKKAEVLAGGWGIMLDDLLAAIYAGIILYLYILLK